MCISKKYWTGVKTPPKTAALREKGRSSSREAEAKEEKIGFDPVGIDPIENVVQSEVGIISLDNIDPQTTDPYLFSSIYPSVNDIPNEIKLIIYSYVGNNFIVDKSLYELIKKIREKFYKDPIKLYYRVTRWRFPKNWAGERSIINRFNTPVRPNMKVFKTK